jgi:hypothetical protein
MPGPSTDVPLLNNRKLPNIRNPPPVAGRVLMTPCARYSPNATREKGGSWPNPTHRDANRPSGSHKLASKTPVRHPISSPSRGDCFCAAQPRGRCRYLPTGSSGRRCLFFGGGQAWHDHSRLSAIDFGRGCGNLRRGFDTLLRRGLKLTDSIAETTMLV